MAEIVRAAEYPRSNFRGILVYYFVRGNRYIDISILVDKTQRTLQEIREHGLQVSQHR